MYHRDLPDGHRPQKKGRGLSGDAAKMPDDWFDDIGVTNVTEDIECSTDGILAATCDTSLCNYVTIEKLHLTILVITIISPSLRWSISMGWV